MSPPVARWLQPPAPGTAPGPVRASGLAEDPLIALLALRLGPRLWRHDLWPDWRCQAAPPHAPPGTPTGMPWSVLGDLDAQALHTPSDADRLEGRQAQRLLVRRVDSLQGGAAAAPLAGLVIAETGARTMQVLAGASATIARDRPWLALAGRVEPLQHWATSQGYRLQELAFDGVSQGRRWLAWPDEVSDQTHAEEALGAGRGALVLDPQQLPAWGFAGPVGRDRGPPRQPGPRGRFGLLLPEPWIEPGEIELAWEALPGGDPAVAATRQPRLWVDGITWPALTATIPRPGALVHRFGRPAAPAESDGVVRCLEVLLPEDWRGSIDSARAWPWRLRSVTWPAPRERGP
jgi:hypothetical protein